MKKSFIMYCNIPNIVIFDIVPVLHFLLNLANVRMRKKMQNLHHCSTAKNSISQTHAEHVQNSRFLAVEFVLIAA